MYKQKKILITICARGGSKGIPGKNIKPLAGKPLITYSIKTAQAFNWADQIIVSTDDQQIKQVAETAGVKVPFIRPAHLSNDTVSRVDAIVHAAKQAEKHYKTSFDIIMDLGVTSPLRNQQDMEAVIKKLVDTPQTDSVFTVTPSDRSPYFNMVEPDDSDYAHLSKTPSKRVTARQQAPKVYDMNDSIYAIWKDKLYKHNKVRLPRTRIHIMPEERSIDIDRLVDFKLAEFLIKEQEK
jgi:CMP-N,N'-diacetyllegionaminic acid synthase